MPAGANSQFWLGATDQTVEGEWRWTDGSLFWLGENGGSAQNGLFSYWYFREPNNVGNMENCAVMETKSAAGDWYDFSCTVARAYSCESL